jgi:hypothetical protein
MIPNAALYPIAVSPELFPNRFPAFDPRNRFWLASPTFRFEVTTDAAVMVSILDKERAGVNPVSDP